MSDASECFHDTGEAAAFADAKLRKVNLHESPHMFCDVYGLQPGQTQKVHAHAGSDKIYHGLTGTAQVTIGDVVRAIGPGELAVAPAGVEHGVSNTSDTNCTLLVVMAPHPAFDGGA
jgi:quercetin dioxygenase-like cupin family protein